MNFDFSRKHVKSSRPVAFHAKWCCDNLCKLDDVFGNICLSARIMFCLFQSVSVHD